MLALLDKFDGEELEKITLFLPLRKNKKIKIDDDREVVIYESLVKDIIALENNNIDIPTLVFNNTNLTSDEIEYLPFSLYLELRDKIINFDNDEDTQAINENATNHKKK